MASRPSRDRQTQKVYPVASKMVVNVPAQKLIEIVVRHCIRCQMLFESSIHRAIMCIDLPRLEQEVRNFSSSRKEQTFLALQIIHMLASMFSWHKTLIFHPETPMLQRQDVIKETIPWRRRRNATFSASASNFLSVKEWFFLLRASE